MAATVIVLGMHRSGTALVTQLLHRMGVFMGGVLGKATWEDLDFLELNQTILDMAGGNWGKPPSPEAITDAVARMPIPYFLTMKRQPTIWGWKNPRACLTIHALHPFFEDPHYVVVERKKRDIISSLCLREGWKHNWGDLIDVYLRRLNAFVDTVDAPALRLDYEGLTDPKQAPAEVGRLADFLGLEVGDAEDVIRFSQPVDWKTTHAAVLTDDERQWLYNRSAELQGQLEEPVILHVGVEYGGSLHCCRAGAPNARLIGVDLDNNRFIGRAGVEFVTGDSPEVGYNKVFDKLDLLFIDGDHNYEAVRADINAWISKVRPGGIIAFHDYAPTEDTLEKAPWVDGVQQAVDDWKWMPTTWEALEGADSIKAFRRLPLLRRGEEWGSIGLGTPYFKARYGFFRWWSWLLVGGLRDGDQLLNTRNVIGEAPIPMAHNSLVREFLMNDRDTFCMIEDDHEGPQDILSKIRDKIENREFDIVCASYINRRGDMMAVGYEFVKDEPVGDYGEYTCRIEPMNIDRKGTQAYDHGGACLGLVFVRRWVLEAMQKTYHPQDNFWFDWNGRNSQDIVFYGRALEVGARTGVDRDNDIGHLGDKLYRMDEYYQMMDEAEAGALEVSK